MKYLPNNPAAAVIAAFQAGRDVEQANLQRVRDAYNASPTVELRRLLCHHHNRFMAACAVVDALANYANLIGPEAV